LYDKHPKRDGTNQERICQELDDLLAIVDLLNTECGLSFRKTSVATIRKVEKVDHYYKYSKDLGMVE